MIEGKINSHDVTRRAEASGWAKVSKFFQSPVWEHVRFGQLRRTGRPGSRGTWKWTPTEDKPRYFKRMSDALDHIERGIG